jgi:hypothetical protein
MSGIIVWVASGVGTLFENPLSAALDTRGRIIIDVRAAPESDGTLWSSTLEAC